MDGPAFDRWSRRLARRLDRRRAAGLAGLAAALLADPARALGRAQRCDDGRRPCGGECCEPGFECAGTFCVLAELPDIPGPAPCLSLGNPCLSDMDCDFALGESCCYGTCVNATCDADNCGTCDRSCGGGLRCVAGSCQPPDACPPGMGSCDGGCCTAVEECAGDGSCEPPVGLDYLGVGLQCFEGADGVECSLQRVYGIDNILGCGLEIGLPLVDGLLAASKAPAVVEAVQEVVDLGPDVVETILAETTFDQALAVLGFVLPMDCIEQVAEVLSGGQVTALKLCLADEVCTELLLGELGF